jgi:hypothetical protein
MAVPVLLLSSLACETASIDEAPGSEAVVLPPTATATAVADDRLDCAGLDEDACGQTAGCAPLWGWEPEAYCADAVNDAARRVVGCHASGEACPEEETCAGPEDGSEWLVFPNRCLPAGWEKVPMTACCGVD